MTITAIQRLGFLAITHLHGEQANNAFADAADLIVAGDIVSACERLIDVLAYSVGEDHEDFFAAKEIFYTEVV